MTPTPEMFTQLRSYAPKFAIRVAPLYQLLGWKWKMDRARSMQLPTIRDIQGGALALIDLAEDSVEGTEEVAAGGIHVRMDDHGVHLSFETSVSVFYGETYDENV
jgi:hypothetical protein